MQPDIFSQSRISRNSWPVVPAVTWIKTLFHTANLPQETIGTQLA
jgi:hypothetical protein